MALLWLSASDTDDPTSEFTEGAIALASFVLYHLTGEKYTGVTTSTDAYQTQYFDNTQRPMIVNGVISNYPAHAQGLRNLRLRNQPVHSVQSIVTNGVTMDPESYSLRNNAYLVQNNGGVWALNSHDMLVTYTHGTPIPRAGKLCAVRLANELIHAGKDDGECTLPERVQSVTRQGMSFAILDPQDFIQNGKVGIPMIDYFIQAANPGKAKKKAKIFSVDKPRGERIN